MVTFGRKKVHLTIIRVHHDSRRYHKAEERLGTKTRIRKYKSRRKLCKVMITLLIVAKVKRHFLHQAGSRQHFLEEIICISEPVNSVPYIAA